VKTVLARLIAGTLTVWLIAAWPARWLAGPEAPPRGLIACLLCLAPAVLTLAWAASTAGDKPERQLIAVLGGTLVRMVAVLGGALLLFFAVPLLHAADFWMWVLGFYLFTLALEMALVLAYFRHAAEQPGWTARAVRQAVEEPPAADTLSQ
jgi:hypothetical protein